jgi:hypothetical protein
MRPVWSVIGQPNFLSQAVSVKFLI